VEALHAALDRLSNLEEGLARPYCEEDRIVFGSRRLWGDCHCSVCGFHLRVLLLLSLNLPPGIAFRRATTNLAYFGLIATAMTHYLLNVYPPSLRSR
jgi:hypothetical protein